MTRARTRKKARGGFRCSKCGAKEIVWAGRCPKCGEWDTLKDTSLTPTAEPKRKPEDEALIERVAAMSGVTRKNAAMTVDMLLAPGGLDAATLGAVVNDVAERHRIKRMDNPCGYLVVVARQKLGLPVQVDMPPKDAGKTLEARWGALETRGSGMKPAAALVAGIAEKTKPKKGVKAAVEPEQGRVKCPACADAKFVRRNYNPAQGGRPQIKQCPD